MTFAATGEREGRGEGEERRNRGRVC